MRLKYGIFGVFLVFMIISFGVYWIQVPHLSPDIALHCKLPDIPAEVPKIIVIQESFDSERAYNFSKRFANFTFYSGGSSNFFRHRMYSGLLNLTFYGPGMNNFEFNMPFKERHSVGTMSEEQGKVIANDLIDDMKEYFSSPLEYRLSNTREVYVDPGNVCYYHFSFDIFYNGIELLGNGSNGWVDVSNQGVIGYQLHFPQIEERGSGKVFLSPVEAMNRLDPGTIIFDVKFGYYADYVYPKSYKVLYYGYLVNETSDNSVFVGATAGDAYR